MKSTFVKVNQLSGTVNGGLTASLYVGLKTETAETIIDQHAQTVSVNVDTSVMATNNYVNSTFATLTAVELINNDLNNKISNINSDLELKIDELSKNLSERITSNETKIALLEKYLDEKKEDKIPYITLDAEAITGVIPELDLILLQTRKCAKILHGLYLYRLVYIKQNESLRYSAEIKKDASSITKYIDVDWKTGNFKISSLSDILLDHHLSDQIRHITAEERANWNNKVSCNVTEVIDQDKTFCLNLFK